MRRATRGADGVARSASPAGRSLNRRPATTLGRTDHPGASRHPSSARRGMGPPQSLSFLFQSKSSLERACLTDARFFFASMRRSCAPAGIRVFTRAGRGVSACRIKSENRSIASERFSSWLRVRWETIRSTPSLLIRPPSVSLILRLCSSERVVEAFRSNVKVTRLLTLFTFWPPGPPLLEAAKRSSFSGMAIPGRR